MCQCQKQSQSCCGSNHCGCSCQSQQSSCAGASGSCGCSCHKKSYDHSEKFFELADQAWMEVLKEKIKDNIRANSKNIDELAKLVAEANHERWKKKMEEKQCCGGFDEKLKNFFGSCCKK